MLLWMRAFCAGAMLTLMYVSVMSMLMNVIHVYPQVVAEDERVIDILVANLDADDTPETFQRYIDGQLMSGLVTGDFVDATWTYEVETIAWGMNQCEEQIRVQTPVPVDELYTYDCDTPFSSCLPVIVS